MNKKHKQLLDEAYENMRVNYPYEYMLLKREYRENVKTRPEEVYPEPGTPTYKVSEEALEAVQIEDLVFPGGSWSRKTASYKRTNTSNIYFSRRNF